VPAGPVLSVGEMLRDPQMLARDMGHESLLGFAALTPTYRVF
jgi:crotonobetainyl-CoA:carnitine CoA-transferase CaiB-like acyl-CoA transferase